MRTSALLIAALTSLPMLLMPLAAHADERAELEQLRDTVTDMVEALVASGALSRAKADQLLARARAKAGVAASTAPAAPGSAAVAVVPSAGVGVRSNAPATASAQPPVARPGVRSETATSDPVRVQYVPEAVRNEITQQVKQQVVAQAREERWGEPGAMPDWVERLRFSGDLRVRVQQDNFSGDNAPPAVLYDEYGSGTNYADTTNTTVDRNRLILRARFGVAAIINDQWTSAIRFSTGNTLGPTSTSSTAGDASGRYQVKIDRAYMKWAPNSNLSVLAGRMPNPYLSSDMMFAEELGFDGAAASAGYSLNDQVRFIGVAGAYALKENALGKDRWMSGLQAGVEWRTSPVFGMRVALARYGFNNVAGEQDTVNFGTASYALTQYEAGFRQKGNSLFRINDPVYDTASRSIWGQASQFNVNALTFGFEAAHFDPIVIDVSGELIQNTGWDAADIANRTGGYLVTRGTNGPGEAAVPLHADAEDVDLAVSGLDRLEAGDGAQQGRLARSGGTDQGDHLSGRDGHADAVQRLAGPEGFGHVADHDHPGHEGAGRGADGG
jgi:hypothetical protein